MTRDSLDIWAACAARMNVVTLNGEVVRIVESQEQIATNQLVDDFEEQAILEQLLEQTKPPIPEAARDLSYLLYTPFRYPPLKYGSRFGSRFEPSLFYGSRELTTALSECAYYRLYFWFGMDMPPPSGQLKTQHTAFMIRVHTDKALKLQQPPFSAYKSELIDKASYQCTQPLGTAMREFGITAFEFISARDHQQGLNIALFYADVIQSKQPVSTHSLLCAVSRDGVEFIDEKQIVYQYPLELFMDQGAFPIVKS